MEPQNAIYDARQLGLPHMMILGVQHLFAMFGATVLVRACFPGLIVCLPGGLCLGEGDGCRTGAL